MPKTVVITGANAGIGLATAHRIAASGHTVVMACRNEQKAQAARTQILASNPTADLDVMSLDLSSFEHIRRFAEELAKKHPRVSVLINNAGASPAKQEKTADGFEMQWGANYLGPVLLSHLVLPLLRNASLYSLDSRIINLASIAHNLGRINERTWEGRRLYNTFAAYAQSKLGNLMFSNALARRLPSGITSNALHPGAVASDIYRDVPQPLRALLLKTMIPTERPARLIENMALSPQYRNTTGLYLTAQSPNPVRRYARNEAAQDDLYEKSCWMVGVDPLPLVA
ncbi:SDR family NAD(P)-dependent oxidoreductase [Mycobacteroides abscessus]|uniref:SDR family NAD(P)-dependent oxidoreductase n=1 Tax=Mycobacteroides abscessus TaxID=36809 RepID=A0ABD7HHI3_9MYCO|nr:SDR family NAD(P)-dependent oxidoreductase [Mycobacteroides abscessus]AWG62821.1 KR domain-containing protein [Mycobacteroides abscessus]PVA73723.1 KR domain-containing protein [Mycobacteroides abscessus]PVB11937.1 KR domain-containing protein [Mycobacteroides abscessus]PVB16630.1 KR domain-containing protein [Mycobacteroides abscessus]RIR41879.1 SDR family NAD(P)-dependent oxidoreductase [Mycobacteroides abscessus]